MEKVKSVLLITEVDSFAREYEALAEEVEVTIDTAFDWNTRYRVQDDIIICGSKFLDRIHVEYYNKVTLILKQGESPFQYMKLGINNFIFDYKNHNELLFAFYRKTDALVQEYSTVIFHKEDYNFRWDLDLFEYRNERIYLTKGEKSYLYSWLIAMKKDNNKRSMIFNMRKKFGKDFLADVDRHGNIKE